MWVVLKQADLVVWGRIAEIKPDRLVIAPNQPTTLKSGSLVSMAGLAFGHVPTKVVGSWDGRILLQRPAAVQLWFRTRRSHRRLPLEVPVTLQMASGLVIDGMTEDVSVGGALLLLPGGPNLLASGEEVEMTLAVGEQTISTKAILRFISSVGEMRHIGAQFLSMDDLDRQVVTRRLEDLLANFESGPE
jgi:hypothetical protein